VDGVTASDAEAREWYDWFNAEVNLEYVLFPSDQYTGIELGDEEITQYYEKNKEQYKTQPQLKVRYLFFDPAAFKDKVQISDEQIAEYYYAHPDEFSTEKTVEARHILIKVDEKADQKVVDEKKDEAMEIYKLAKAGEPFDELAKKYSEGPTKDQGGYLGTFGRDSMVKPFADKAFSMSAGEISEPVRTRFGWHIIKVEKVNDAEKRSLEASTDTIKQKLVDIEARKLALAKAEDVYDTTYDGDDLAAVAKAHNLPIETTAFFKRNGLVDARIGNTQQFSETAFALNDMAVSEILDLEKGYYLLQVIDRKAAAIPPIEEVRDRVSADLMKERKDAKAQADAKACMEAATKDKSLEAAAEELGRKIEKTGFFKRTGTIPQIGYEPEISKAAFDLKVESPLAEKPFKVKKGWMVIRLSERKLPDPAGFDKEKENIVNRLTGQKKQAAVQQWLSDLRARGDVKINMQMIK